MLTLHGIVLPLTQLVPLLPVGGVLLGGCIAALVFWDACPRSALLTLLAMLLIGLSTVAGPFVNAWLIQTNAASRWTSDAPSQTTAQLGVRLAGTATLLNLVRAVGFGLLLAAVFSGRRPPPLPSAGTVAPPSPVPPPTL